MRESPSERFEILAAQFYDEMGMMAPGKDDITGEHPYEKRERAWRAWLWEKSRATFTDVSVSEDAPDGD